MIQFKNYVNILKRLMLVLNIMIVIYIYIINKIFLDNYCNKEIVIILLYKKENNQE